MNGIKASQRSSDMGLPCRQFDSLKLGGETPILAVWGGIGFTRRPLRDLRDLYTLHQHELAGFLRHCSSILHDLRAEEGKGHPIELEAWITNLNDKLPPLPADLTMVVTTVLQIARYVVLCKRLGKTPGEIAKCITAYAGHSVGLTVAVAMAAADSWSSLYELAEIGIKGSWYAERHANDQWSGAVASQSKAAAECTRQGEGSPSPMLSITGTRREILEEEINAVNEGQPAEEKIYIALVNDVDSFVASGRPDALVKLCGKFRMRATSDVPYPGAAGTRIPFGNSVAKASLQFIPAVAPFHSPHLLKTAAAMKESIKGAKLEKSQIQVPVWGLDALLQLDPSSEDDLGTSLSKLILSQQCDWVKIMEGMSGRWQVLDFGPGGSNGIGSIISRMKAGSGSKVYTVCPASRRGRASTTAGPRILLSAISLEPEPPSYEHAVFEERSISPCHSAPASAVAMPKSKFTELLGLPRVLVAGMTPTTCYVDLVAAVMNAGYYAELATGGYNDAATLAGSIRKLARSILNGRLITVNVVYADPQRLNWIIPQLSSLVREGCPIGGLTIGAGVPAPAVADEYIRSLELSYIGFKPASVDAIGQVLDIARAHGTLPVVLQWTGGRAGGHHSLEDFHQPILETYQAIRELPNVILVAGSGFGDAEESWPYVSGDWSRRFGRPPMPFDAILIGTCIMTTKEAKTSLEVKKLMVETPGLTDEEWPRTMRATVPEAGDGGVISIVSQLGEAMHVVATRGMKLWAELDETIFNRPKEKMIELLRSRRDYLIARLNADYQKVWFGIDYATRKPVQLSDMTYADVLRRLIELLHPERKNGWSHPTYKTVFDDFMTRTLQRFRVQDTVPANHPTEQLDLAISECAGISYHLLSMEDYQYFVDLCRRRGQRAVPFIAVFDPDFASWFKKDALWQSEDLESTYHGDVGRVCILCGPVAVRKCQAADIPVGILLSDIEQGYVERETRCATMTTQTNVSIFEEPYLTHAMGRAGVLLDNQKTLRLADGADSVSLDDEKWLLLIGSRLGSWGQRLFSVKKLVSGGRAYDNPARCIFAARPGAFCRFTKGGAELYSSAQSSHPDAYISIAGDIATLVVFVRCTRDGDCRDLHLSLRYDDSRPYAPVCEDLNHRQSSICDFYRGVLLGGDELDPPERRLHNMRHKPVTVTREHVLAWIRAVDGTGLDALHHIGPNGEVPVEYITIFVTAAKWRHLLTWDWDLSRLLHQHTTVQILKGHRPLSVGDSVTLNSRIRGLYNRDSGIEVRVHFTFERDGVDFAELTYVFMVLGQRVAEAESFEKGLQTTWTIDLCTKADVEALLAKPWLRTRPDAPPLTPGQTLVMNVRRDVAHRSDVSYAATITGEIWLQDDYQNFKLKPVPPCATLEYVVIGQNYDRTDVVTDFLKRVGIQHGKPMALPEPACKTKKMLKVTVPDNSEQYAQKGGDFNPIHTMPAFARLVGFQTPIWHGNHTAAFVLQLVRREVEGASAATIRRYDCAFPAVVRPGDTLAVTMSQVAVDDGGAVINFSVRVEGSGELVLSGEVSLTAPPAAFLFTGQGSQFTGMGLDMIRRSDASRLVWTTADTYFEENWGFSISDVVRRNPTDLTIHFSGRQGMRIRQNYLDMQEMVRSAEPQLNSVSLFEGLHAGSRSYTLSHEDGMLSMTQFAQPAIFVVEKAAFEYLKSLDRVPLDTQFAGHSLGEFAAIGCMTSVLPLEAALKIVFVRGALMQAAVTRNSSGRSGFGMVAVDPSRIGEDCREGHILSVVKEIADCTGLLLEIVNFNIAGRQYVCAGDKRCLQILQKVTDDMCHDPSVLSEVEWRSRLVSRHKVEMGSLSPLQMTLIRGKATIPLRGIDVPFHSSLLASVRPLFRHTLAEGISKDKVTPGSLIGKWIPNVTGKLFAIDREYVLEVARMTGSEKLQNLAADL